MRKLALLLLWPSLVFAGGPKNSYPSPRGLDDEIRNIYHDIANPIVNYGSASSFTVTSLLGITNGTAACAGCVGEVLSVVDSSGASVPTTSTYGNALSLALTAGHWLLFGAVEYLRNGATWSEVRTGFSVNSSGFADSVRISNYNEQQWNSSAATTQGIVDDAPVVNVNISATTTYYLKIQAIYTVGTPVFYAYMMAVRVQ